MKKTIAILLLSLTVIMHSCSEMKEANGESSTEKPKSDNYYDEVENDLTDNLSLTEDASTNSPFNGTWYLSEWESYPQESEKTMIFDETNGTFIKLPAVYEESVDGLLIKVEFFKETYTLYSLIQCRVTITNNLGYSINFNGKAVKTPGAFSRIGTNALNKVYAAKNFESIYHANVLPVYLDNGDSFINETVFEMKENFFVEGFDYSFVIEVTAYSEDKDTKIYSVEIPIELCIPQNE